MTELQKVFLFYTAIYFVVKGALFLGFYVFLIMWERTARLKHKKYREIIEERRRSEQERWKVAYELCYKKQSVPLAPALKKVS
ncbi:MAG TPA: hypothetical protein GX404_04715 [Syntrophomonadaceae bacterium]|nr:hypothetical protein [Syntrophomonadaceae bacterium]